MNHPPYPAPMTPKSSGAGRALLLAFVIGIPLVILVMVAAGGFAYAIFKATSGPRDATHAFLRDARKGDWDAAYDKTSADYQSRVERSAFEADIENEIPKAAESDDATFNNTNIQNDVACLSGSLSPGDGTIFVQLHKKGDGWLIDRIGTQPTPACMHR